MRVRLQAEDGVVACASGTAITRISWSRISTVASSGSGGAIPNVMERRLRQTQARWQAAGSVSRAG